MNGSTVNQPSNNLKRFHLEKELNTNAQSYDRQTATIIALSQLATWIEECISQENLCFWFVRYL